MVAPEIINGRWQIQEKVGSGRHTTVFKALNLFTKKQVAAKINSNAHNRRRLLREKWAYGKIMVRCGIDHQTFIPTLHDYRNNGNTEVLVFDLMGPIIYALMTAQGHPFDLQSVVSIFQRTLTCIESLHKSGMAHRDVKPENICVSKGTNREDIRLIGLGFCVPYIHERTGMHNELVYRNGLTTSFQYCSLNQQLGGSATRLDDLEALCFSMMWVLTGSLPWDIPTDVNITEAEAFNYVLLCKSQPVEKICVGFPKFFEQFLLYVKNLRFNSDPDYDHLHHILERESLNL